MFIAYFSGIVNYIFAFPGYFYNLNDFRNSFLRVRSLPGR